MCKQLINLDVDSSKFQIVRVYIGLYFILLKAVIY